MSRTHSTAYRSMARWSALALTAGALGLSGCSANFGDVATSGAAAVSASGTGLQGRVHGGQQPVTGATIQLYGVGTSGYGSAATPLLTRTITTDQNGGFNITGDYTCPSSNIVYLMASGGNPGLSSGVGTGNNNTNPAITLMAALPPCSTMKTNASSSFININEVTTVAAVWALQQFASTTSTAMSANTTTASDNIGTTSTNIQGLANAMAVANVLASTSTGISPGSNTSGNQSNVEYWQINTLANILAACVNTGGATTTGNNCGTLFSNVGVPSGTNPATGVTYVAPTDTFQAALYMAQSPNTNVSTLVALSSSSAPFQPANTTTNDLTVGLSYNTAGHDSRWIALDQFGNAWVTTSGAAIVELDPTGNIISTPASYTLSGASSATAIVTSYEVAVDTANNAWFTDETKPAIFEVVGSTSAGGANGGSGTAVSTSAVSTGLLEGIVVDGSNNVWASITGSHIVGLMNGAYTSLVTGGSVTSSPFMMAVDLSNQAKFGNTSVSNGGSYIYALDSGGCSGLVPAYNSTTMAAGTGTGGSIAMAFTTAGTVNGTAYLAGASTPLNYIVDSACANTTNVAPVGGRVLMSTPYGIAFDNSNEMWIVNQNYTSSSDATSGKYSLSKMPAQTYGSESAFTGAVAGPAMTFTSYPGTPIGLNAPYYLAMDGNSAAWVANSAGAGVSAISNSGTAISPPTGFSGGTYVNGTTTSARLYNSARGIAIDGSGNVWVASTGGTYVTLLVGQAAPAVTPLALGIKNGTLASRP